MRRPVTEMGFMKASSPCRRRSWRHLRPAGSVRFVGAITIATLGLWGACEKQDPAVRHYYDQRIQPVFDSFCVGNTSPCHRIDSTTGAALGNLDLSSFEAVQKRRDVLRNYGAYPQPLLLAKALPDVSLLIPYAGKLLPGEIRHAGGKTLAPSSDAYFELKRWLDAGATRDGQSPEPESRTGAGGCTPFAGEVPALKVDRNSAAYQTFSGELGTNLVASCAFSNCHGSSQADFRLTCADTEEARLANFARAAAFVAVAPARVEESEILLRPLSPRAGGLSHTGGTFFDGRENRNWQDLRAWAALVQLSPPEVPARSPGATFFAAQVMPVLLKRGCALEGCHSPNGFNDYRLRPGSVGFLAPVALDRNYETTLHEFMALDTPDVRQSRLVKKNLLPSSGGITHRGGPLLESPGSDTNAPCPTPFHPDTASAFCVIEEWHRIERTDHAARVSTAAANDVIPIAFVARPPDPDGPLAFDTFRGGADLRLGNAHVGARGRIERIDGVKSALASCSELTGRTDVDVRGPEWSPDGSRLIFAARIGEAGGLDLWQLDVAMNRCQRLTDTGGRIERGVRQHNFDPVFAPDGSVVFASTRSGRLTPKRFLPNADLYRVGPGLDFSAPEVMTVLTGSELAPAFMQNGQLSFTAEKATPDFYQLSGRRLNWDLTDYHPLLAQRAKSADTFGGEAISVGHQQATEIREALDRNFLVVLSGTDAQGGGGALGVFNRSVGPFEEGRTEVTFLRALHLVDPAATGRDGTRGVYRSPSSLPNGEVLASYAADVTNPARDVPRYDLVAVVEGGARRVLVPGGAQSLVEAVLGLKRSSRLLFRNVPQLVFGGHVEGSGEANVHFPDLPMLATLLDANLRRGRNVAAFDNARYLAVYEAGTPPSASPDATTLQGTERVFTQRQLLGTAPLKKDGSLRVILPSRRPLILELQDGNHAPLFTMREEHQLGPGEHISPGVPRGFFDGVCGGCHGSRSGAEPDIAVTADALTGATMSLSRSADAESLR
jgi:hypothetical protein